MISCASGASLAISWIGKLSSVKEPRALSFDGSKELLFIGYS